MMSSSTVDSMRDIQERMARLRGGGKRPLPSSVNNEMRDEVATALGEISKGVASVIAELRGGGNIIEIRCALEELRASAAEVSKVADQLR
jgi:hypothetical protein